MIFWSFYQLSEITCIVFKFNCLQDQVLNEKFQLYCFKCNCLQQEVLNPKFHKTSYLAQLGGMDNFVSSVQSFCMHHSNLVWILFQRHYSSSRISDLFCFFFGMVVVTVTSFGCYVDLVVKVINDHIQIVVVFCFFFYRNPDVILPYWFLMFSSICCSWCSIHCSGFDLADLKILIWLDFFRWQPAIWKKFLFSFLLKFNV